MKRILILGHTGFIGSHLEACLHKKLPEREIVGMSSASADLTKKEGVLRLENFFDMETTVIMCSTIMKQFGDNLDSFSKNMKMIMNICHFLESHPVKRFVFLSSVAVYGEDIQNTNITEETKAEPRSYYGMAKYISECLLRKVFDKKKEGSFLIMRPPVVYGPGEKGRAYGPTGFVRAVLSGEGITLRGDGSERREFIFIEDLLEITYRLMFREYNEMFNIVSGRNYSFRDIISIISKLTPLVIQVQPRPRTKKKADHRFDNQALMQVLCDFSFTGLEEGIKKTIASEKVHHHDFKN